MAKVTRKPTGVRRSAAARNRSQKAHAARKHTSGLLDRVMAALAGEKVAGIETGHFSVRGNTLPRTEVRGL